jgi:hypothetical protein
LHEIYMSVSLDDYSDREFSASFGVSKATAQVVLTTIVALNTGFAFEMRHILWTLFFLKCYCTVDVSAHHWNIDQKTYAAWVWRSLSCIATFPLVNLFLCEI